VDVRSAEAGTGTWFGPRGGRGRLRLLMLASLLGLWPLRASAAGGAPVRTEVRPPSRWAALYARLPLSFEVNQGQSDRTVEYLAHGPGYTLWLTADQAVLALKQKSEGPGITDAVLRMKLVRANQQATISGLNELPGKSNYFIGNDPEKWRTDIPNYAQVKYANIYPGVDLVYYGNEGRLEYDFVVQPGADPRQIVLDVGNRPGRVAMRPYEWTRMATWWWRWVMASCVSINPWSTSP